MSDVGPIETYPDGCMTFPNPGASGDFEAHPIGTSARLKELEDQAIRHREDKAHAVADAVMRARKEWAARATQETA